MKNLFLVIACAILCAACGNNGQPTTLSNQSLVGKVKKITIKEYKKGEMRFGDWVPAEETTRIYEYGYTKKGLLKSYKIFEGDSIINQWSDKESDETYKFRNGWLTEYRNGNYSEHTEFAGDIPTKTTTTYDGEISSIYIYSNVADRNNYTMEEYSPDGKKLRERRVVVDGKTVELSDSETPYIATAKYDERGNIVESANCDTDYFGNIKSLRWCTERNKYSYTYDKQGNWTKRVKFEVLRHSNELREIVTREIVYW